MQELSKQAMIERCVQPTALIVSLNNQPKSKSLTVIHYEIIHLTTRLYQFFIVFLVNNIIDIFLLSRLHIQQKRYRGRDREMIRLFK